MNLIADVQRDTDQKLAEERRQAQKLADETVATAGEMLRQTEERVDVRIAALKRLLDEVRDPTSGELRPLEEIYEALFELHRDDALRADEYGELQYPAAGYDEEMLEAHPYDVYGKLLLAVWNGIVDEMTAGEYDALQLSAEAFEAYDLSAAKYDLSAKSLLA